MIRSAFSFSSIVKKSSASSTLGYVTEPYDFTFSRFYWYTLNFG